MNWGLIGHAENKISESYGKNLLKVFGHLLSAIMKRKTFLPYLFYVHCQNPWFDVDNYLIWTDDIMKGEWSKQFISI